MKRLNLPLLIAGILTTIVGVIAVSLTRGRALVENAATSSTVLFALSLICTVVGIVMLVVSFNANRPPVETRTLTMASLFAALCYIGFSYCKIDIPVGGEKTAFHLGNVFCVLAALFVGGFWGGMSGAIGMTIADLTSNYITSAPKTFILKLCIGLITGLIAHKIFRISQNNSGKKVPLPVATVLSCIGGMAFNMVADPVVGYFYKMYVLGVPQKAASVWAKMGAVTTAVNAVIAVISASVLYLALQPALKKARLLPKV